MSGQYPQQTVLTRTGLKDLERGCFYLSLNSIKKDFDSLSIPQKAFDKNYKKSTLEPLRSWTGYRMSHGYGLMFAR